MIRSLESYSTQVTVYDPWANPEEVMHEYGLTCHAELDSASNSLPIKYDAIILAVAHNEFQVLDFEALKKENGVVYDVKGILGTKADKKL